MTGQLVGGGEQPFLLSIDTNQTNAVLTTLLAAAGWAGEMRHFIVTIETGVLLQASATGTYALDFGSFPAGSKLTLINRGAIRGKGGSGGGAGCGTGGGGNGSAGGPALRATLDFEIDNTQGIVTGGGGGGGGAGGGQGQIDQGGEGGGTDPCNACGGGGGNGAGPNAQTGGAGGNCCGDAVVACGGTGGSGGGYGLAGANGSSGSHGGGGAGGAAGAAIVFDPGVTATPATIPNTIPAVG